MAVTFNRERATKVVLVVLGLLTAVTNINALVTSFLALRPTGGTTAPMFYTILAALGVFLVLAARNPSAYRSLIAYAVWSSVAHGAVMALMAIQLPTKRGELLVGAALAGLGAALLFVFAPRKETALATSCVLTPVPLSLRVLTPCPPLPSGEGGRKESSQAASFVLASRNSGCFHTQSSWHSRIVDPLRRLRPAQRFALARALRHRPTPTERYAWTLLRNRGILGLKFRRQHELHGFIVDFYCASESVVIELEGSVHDGAARQSYDRPRAEFLVAAG